MDPRALARLLGSRRFAVAVMLAWVGMLLVWVVPFQFYGLPNDQVRTIISREPFFRVLYVALAANTVACVSLRVRSAWRRATGALDRADSGASRAARSLPLAFDSRKAESALKRAGARRIESAPGRVWGVRNRWSPIGTVVSHTGLVVLVIAASVAAWPGGTFDGEVVVAEGEAFGGLPEEYASVIGTPTTYPPLAFAVRRVTPEFHEDILLFTKLEAELAPDEGSRRLVRVSDPWIVSPTTALLLKDFGYALEVRSELETSAPSTSVFKLKAFPSGQEDSFELADPSPGVSDSYRFDVTVYGDYVDRDGAPGVRSFNLADPRVLVSVTRLLSNGEERRVVDRALVRPGGRVSLPGGDVVIGAVTHWGRFRVWRNGATPIALLGVLLGAGGLAGRLLFPRWEATVAAADGGCTLAVWTDVYGGRRVGDAVARELGIS